MSRRAISFVEDWVRENINAQPYLDEEGRDTRPGIFAAEGLAAAEAVGISKAEIEEEFDLESTMAAAINEAADGEVDRLVAKDMR